MTTAFTVVIPSRYASTRLPGKPLLDIAGKPMIQHVWEQASKSSAGRVVVDKLLAVDALVFLVSAVLSFASMRVHDGGSRFEAWGENVFIGALGLLALGALVLAFVVN